LQASDRWIRAGRFTRATARRRDDFRAETFEVVEWKRLPL